MEGNCQIVGGNVPAANSGVSGRQRSIEAELRASAVDGDPNHLQSSLRREWPLRPHVWPTDAHTSDTMSQSTSETVEECVSTVDLPASDKHRLLADGQRRLALALLAERRNAVEVAELAAAIARRESGDEPVGEEAVERVTIALHHRHLPVMDDLGVVDYDADQCRVDPEGAPHIAQDGQLEW